MPGTSDLGINYESLTRMKMSLHLRIFLLLLWILFHCGDGYHCPYGQHCNVFEPAPPGRAPPCAKPGLTYCVDPEPYPADVIRELIEAGRYDVHKLLSDESRDDFNANRKPDYPYGYGPNSLPHVDQISLVNQPYDFNTNNVHNRYNHDIFHHKTPLQPPSPADPVPYDINTYQQTNYTKFGYNYQTPQNNYWNTQNQFGNNYDKKIFRHNNLPPNVAVYNQHFFDQEFDPNYEWAPTRFKQSTNEVTHYNPSEWWKYVVAPSHSDVSIQRSVTFPTRTTTARRSVRGRRDAEPAAQRTLSGGEALRVALGLASAGTEERGAGGGGARRARQAPDTEQLCPARTDFIQPRAALNNKGNWRYVVNMPDAMTQLVRVELCRSSVCNGICSLPTGYTSRCEQKYIQKRLMALGQSGDNLYTDVFWFPSCCQCTITQDGAL